MGTQTIKRFQRAIREAHGCGSRFAEVVRVREAVEGDAAIEAKVYVFGLVEHPTADRCYAWSWVGSDMRERTVAVLREGPVDSPKAAVQAWIVGEYRKGGGGHATR